MARVHCTKCGILGSSKNPHTRNVFPDDGDPRVALDTILSWSLKIKERDEPHYAIPGETTHHVTVSFDLMDDDPVKALQYLQGLFARDEFDPTIIGCVHTWELMPGQKAEC